MMATPTTSRDLPALERPGAENVIIALDNVSLWRRTQEEFHYDLKRFVFALVQRRYRAPQRRRVLHDVNLQIGSGEKIGIIGANGSGKSTLLKVIAGILKPTSGSVAVHGAIAPLIELGAGFDVDLSVVDNILYYGVLLGRRRKEMESRVEAILDFAELADHARNPLKALSSGMIARLGFSIATDVRPEILILDEVLAVGDESFRRKSYERISRFWDKRSTIIVVSHDPGFVSTTCEKAILIENGRVIEFGPSAAVVAVYAQRLAAERAIVNRELIERLNDRVVRGDGSEVEEQRLFLIRDGKKHWIPHPDWLIRTGVSYPDDITFLEAGTVQHIPWGESVE